MPRKFFNWQGIRDNGDGSFTTENKAARKRILKEFHRQGISARSTRIEGDGWKISPIGYKPFKKSYQDASASFDDAPAYRGIRPRTLYPSRHRYPGRYYPRPRYNASGYGPVYRAPPRIGGPSVISTAGQKISRWRQLRREAKERDRLQAIENKKTEREITEKMRSERIAAEREETARTVRERERAKEIEYREQERKKRQEREEVVRQLQKQEFKRQELAHQRHEQAERMRARMSQPTHGGAISVPPKKEPPKPSSAEIQKSREDFISSG